MRFELEQLYFFGVGLFTLHPKLLQLTQTLDLANIVGQLPKMGETTKDVFSLKVKEGQKSCHFQEASVLCKLLFQDFFFFWQHLMEKILMP